MGQPVTLLERRLYMGASIQSHAEDATGVDTFVKGMSVSTHRRRQGSVEMLSSGISFLDLPLPVY